MEEVNVSEMGSLVLRLGYLTGAFQNFQRHVSKFNPCHEPRTGRFCSTRGGGGASAGAKVVELGGIKAQVGPPPLSESEKDAMAWWQEDGYRQINGSLLGTDISSETTDRAIEALDRVIARSVLQQDTTLYRGVHGKHAERLRSLPPGTEFETGTFFSTSASKEGGLGFVGHWNDKIPPRQRVLVVVHAPKGSHAAPMTLGAKGIMAYEKEFLIGRNAQFRVKKVQKVRERGVYVYPEERARGITSPGMMSLYRMDLELVHDGVVKKVEKFNPCHESRTGRFCSTRGGGGSGTSGTAPEIVEFGGVKVAIGPPPLSKAEKDTLSRYQEKDYERINRALIEGKSGSKQVDQDIERMDNILKRTKLAEDATLYRGIEGKYAATVNELPVGSEFKHPAFFSASSDPETAFQFAARSDSGTAQSRVVFKVQAPKGTPVAPIRGSEGFMFEDEFVLKRGSRFRIQQKRVIEGFDIYDEMAEATEITLKML